jgi:hypothetical protein
MRWPNTFEQTEYDCRSQSGPIFPPLTSKLIIHCTKRPQEQNVAQPPLRVEYNIFFLTPFRSTSENSPTMRWEGEECVRRLLAMIFQTCYLQIRGETPEEQHGDVCTHLSLHEGQVRRDGGNPALGCRSSRRVGGIPDTKPRRTRYRTIPAGSLEPGPPLELRKIRSDGCHSRLG